MPIRFGFAALVLAACAMAQPGPGRGSMGRFGPGDARLLGAMAGGASRVVRNAPYSADQVTETTQVLADGNRIHQVHTSKVFRDSDGRVRTEQSLGGLGPLASATARQERVVFINDPVSGQNLALNPRERTATRTRYQRPGPPTPEPARGRPQQASAPGRAGAPPSGPAGRTGGRPDANHRPAGRQNGKVESLGRQNFDGVSAEGTRTTVTIPAGEIGNEQPIQMVSEVWISAELQTVVYSRQSDPSVGETIFKLTNISRAEPAAALFQAPAEFRVNESPAGRGGPRW